MSIAQIETLYDAAVAAFEAADYATAASKATQLGLRIDATSDQRHGTDWMNWRTGAPGLTAFLAKCAKGERAASAASSGVFRQSKVTFARPTA
jgi:hypothetical protein